jgi:hypothetical protein
MKIKSVIRTLKSQRKVAAGFVEKYTKEIELIDQGIAALGGRTGRPKIHTRRKMSAAGRRKIAAAQRARWAKIRAKAKAAKAKSKQPAAA